MSQRPPDCRIAEWAELVGESVPDWACEDPRARPDHAHARPTDAQTPPETRRRERPE